VDNLKNGLKEHLHRKRSYSQIGREANAEAERDMYFYYKDADKAFPPAMSRVLARHMASHPDATDDWHDFYIGKLFRSGI